MSDTPPRPRRRRIVVAGLLGGVAAGLILLLQVIPYGLSRPLTPVDEIGHIDYAVQLSIGHWPRWGDVYTQQTLYIADCGGNGFGPSGSCHPHPRTATDYWPSGWSYESQQPPLGYAAHAVIARGAGLAEPQQQLSWLRGTSLFLGVIGLLAIGGLAGALAPTMRVAFAAATPVALLPEVVNATQFVTNDSVLLIAGTVAIVPGLLALLRPRTPQSWLLVLAGLSGVIVALIKSVALVAVLAMILWAVLALLRDRRRGSPGSWRALTCMGVQLSAGAVTTLAFIFAQQVMGSVPSRQVMDSVLSDSKVSEFPWTPLAVGLREAVTMPFHDAHPVTEFRNGTVALITAVLLVSLLLVSAYPGPTRLKSLNPVPIALVGAAIAGIAVFTLGLLIWGGYGVAMPSRYLIALVPLAALMGLKGLDRMRGLAWLVPPLGLTLVVVMVWPIVPLWLGWE